MSTVTHAYIYDHSMLEHEVQASTLSVFCQVKYPSEEEDTRAWQSPMVTVTLIMPLEMTTVILLPSHLSNISATTWIQLQSLNAIIKVNKITPWLFSAKSNTPQKRKTHAPDSHQWSPLPWLCLLRRRPWFYFQVTYQVSQLRHGFSYDRSML